MSKEEARKCRLHLLNRDKEKTSIFFLLSFIPEFLKS